MTDPSLAPDRRTDHHPQHDRLRRPRVEPSRREVGRVIVGQDDLVRQLTACSPAATSLLEGVPGLGKTMLVRTLADVIDCTSTASSSRPT